MNNGQGRILRDAMRSNGDVVLGSTMEALEAQLQKTEGKSVEERESVAKVCTPFFPLH